MTCPKCGAEMRLVTCEWCLGDGEDIEDLGRYRDCCRFCAGEGQWRTCPSCEEEKR